MKMNFKLNIVAISCCLLLVTSSAIAGERVVCANGHVQYTPCLNGELKVGSNPLQQRSIRSTRRAMPRTNRQSGYVRVMNKSFKRVKHNLGLWYGQLKGEGNVKLRLHIMRNGKVVSTRYMGSVQIHPKEKPTHFNFRSPLPNGKNWSWKIVSSVS
jgi:hypothetical protein